MLRITCSKAPPLANTPASGSQQAARAQPKGSLRLLSAMTAKSISEVKPSNKRGAHQMKAAGYATQGNGPKSVRRERESRQLPFSPELRMAVREEGFTEYFVNLVV